MSWGERSCSVVNCKIGKIENCNVLCNNYTWNEKTIPDSIALLTKTQIRIIKNRLKKVEGTNADITN